MTSLVLNLPTNWVLCWNLYKGFVVRCLVAKREVRSGELPLLCCCRLSRVVKLIQGVDLLHELEVSLICITFIYLLLFCYFDYYFTYGGMMIDIPEDKPHLPYFFSIAG